MFPTPSSAAGAPASTTSSSRKAPSRSGPARSTTSSRFRRSCSSPAIPAAPSRSRPSFATGASRFRRSIRSSCSIGRSGARTRLRFECTLYGVVPSTVLVLLRGRVTAFLSRRATARLRVGRPFPEMLGRAARADAVGEHRVRALRDVLFDRDPLLLGLADVLAVGADREQALQLLHFGLEAEDPLGDAQASAQLLRVDRLGNEIVGARFERLEVPLLSAPPGYYEDVHVAGVLARPDVLAEIEAVHRRHHPVGNHDVDVVLAGELLEGLGAVRGRDDLVPERLEHLAEQEIRCPVVFRDQHFHGATLLRTGLQFRSSISSRQGGGRATPPRQTNMSRLAPCEQGQNPRDARWL